MTKFRSILLILIALLLILGITGSNILNFYMFFIEIVDGHISFSEVTENINIYIKSFLDRRGGRTPEKTYQMFIDALKAEKTGLASQYFVVENQKHWEGELGNLKNNGELVGFVLKLENTRKVWDDFGKNEYDDAMFVYDNRLHDNLLSSYEGQEVGAIRFDKYPFGNWKIESLY